MKKKGGILKVTQELLSDTAENVIAYLKKWIAKKSKATRNFMIVAKIREITTDADRITSYNVCYTKLLRTEGKVVPADMVHHIIELSEDYSKRCTLDNLISVSSRTHKSYNFV